MSAPENQAPEGAELTDDDLLRIWRKHYPNSVPGQLTAMAMREAVDAALAAQPQQATVEVWRGERKVTIYPGENVMRMEGKGHALEFVSDVPHTLESAQAALDWLYDQAPAPAPAEPVNWDVLAWIDALHLKDLWWSCRLEGIGLSEAQFVRIAQSLEVLRPAATPSPAVGAEQHLIDQIREVCAATLKAGPGVAVPIPNDVRAELLRFMRGEPNLIEKLPFCDVQALAESPEIVALANANANVPVQGKEQP